MRVLASPAWLVLAAAPVQADVLLDQALANGGAYAPAEWAYVSTTKVAAGGTNVVGDAWHRLTDGARAKPPTRNTRVVTFDPSKPAGSQQVVIEDDTAPSREARRALNTREGRGDTLIHSDEDDRLPSYADMRQIVKPDAAKVADTVATATYRFKVAPKDIRTIGSADIDIDSDTPLPMLDGTAVIQKTGPFAPYVKTVTVALPTNGGKGRGNAVGKVKQMSMGFRFAPDPKRGTKLLRAFGFDTSLQALGLMTVDVSTLNTVASYRFVGR